MIDLPQMSERNVIATVVAITVAVFVLVLLAAWLSARDSVERRLAGRVASLGRGVAEQGSRKSAGAGIASSVLRAIGNALGGSALLSEKDRRDLERSVAAAGYRPQNVVPIVIGLKVVLLIAIFPANVHIAVHNVPVFGAAEGAGPMNWVRLALQALLIVWAWWYTLPDDA